MATDKQGNKSTARCKGRNKRGEPCSAPVLIGGEFCYSHEPSKARERILSRRKGGHARHGRRLSTTTQRDTTDCTYEPATLNSAAEILALLERAVNDVLVLENSNQRGRTLSTLAGTALKVLEVGELEERIAALEGSIKPRS